jgi:hypothetical protein
LSKIEAYQKLGKKTLTVVFHTQELEDIGLDSLERVFQ